MPPLFTNYGLVNPGFSPAVMRGLNSPAPVKDWETPITGTNMFTNEAGLNSSEFDIMSGSNAYNMPEDKGLIFPGMPDNTDTKTAITNLANSGIDIDTLTKRMITDAGTISSSQGDIENYMSQAVNSREASRVASNTAVNESYGREGDYSLQKLVAQRDDTRRTGGTDLSLYATSYLDKEIEKSLRDLDSRKQEAISANDAAAFKDISDLQVKALQFRQDAMKDHFNRLTGIGGMISSKAEVLGNVANMTRNLSKDQLDYEMEKTKINLQNETRLDTKAVEWAKLAIMDEQGVLKYNNKAPSEGWTDAKTEYTYKAGMATELAKMLTAQASRGKYTDANGVQHTVTPEFLYDSMLQNALQTARLHEMTGVSDKNATLKGGGFVNTTGMPLELPNGTWLYKDGTNITPTDAQRKGLLNATTQLNVGTSMPNGINTNIKDISKKTQKVSSADAIISDVLGFMTGAKTAYADTGEETTPNVQYPLNEDGTPKSFMDVWIDKILGKPEVMYDRQAEEKASSVKNTTVEANVPKAMPIKEIISTRQFAKNPLPNTGNENLDKMLVAMATFEGYFGSKGNKDNPKNIKPIRNNNPINLKFAGQPNAVNSGDFAKFPTAELGWKAGKNQLLAAMNGTSSNYTPDMTIDKFISTFAPKEDNNRTSEYITHVTQKLGISKKTTLKELYDWIIGA